MIDDNFITLLKAQVVRPSQGSSESIENVFARALSMYDDWLNGLPAPTSKINHRLHFLRLIADELDDDSIRKNDGIVDVVLNGGGV